MAKFKYTVSNSYNNTDTGIIQSNSQDEAKKLLNDQNLTVINIEEVIEKRQRGFHKSKKVKLLDKVVFFDHLAQMLKAGLSLLETLEALSDDTENPYFKMIIEDIGYGIETGNTFSSGMGKYPDVFPHLFIKMIEVGEIGGTLEESSRQISTQVKKDYDLRAKVKCALIYPEILIGIMLIAGGGLLIFVIPQLSTFFKQSGLQLPITTQILIGISEFLRSYWYILIILIIGGKFALSKLKKNGYFLRIYDRFILKAPIIGAISHKINVAIFSRTLGSLLKSGVPISKALEITADSVTNSLYKNSILEFKDQVEKGVPLSVLMAKERSLYPNLATRMVAVGDKTGTSPDMLFNVADFYQQQVNETLGNISTIIEPVMLFIMGIATLFIALSVITPIYQLTSGIAGSK